jgi:hypothetical protein
VKLHHTQPESGVVRTTEHSLDATVLPWEQAPADFRFAAAVAEFGMVLRDSQHKGTGSLASVLDAAENAKGADPRDSAPDSSIWCAARRRSRSSEISRRRGAVPLLFADR